MREKDRWAGSGKGQKVNEETGRRREEMQVKKRVECIEDVKRNWQRACRRLMRMGNGEEIKGKK